MAQDEERVNIQGLNGFIKIHRKLLEWGWYQDNTVKAVFLHLLLTASFKDCEWMGEKVKKGQVIIGMQKLADDLGFSRQQVRTAINKLKKTNEITTKSTNRYTVVTILNWEEYQDKEENKEPSKNQLKAFKEPHLKKVENENNEKKVKNISNAEKEDIALIKLPLKDGSQFSITEKMVCEWQEIYSDTDVFRELKKMRVWSEANPEKRKTKKGIMRFITGWLARPKTYHEASLKKEDEDRGRYDDLTILTRKREMQKQKEEEGKEVELL